MSVVANTVLMYCLGFAILAVTSGVIAKVFSGNTSHTVVQEYRGQRYN
ncbi:hypothetical protein [Anaeromusa acidaminophila]|nr:hypothetical protein [Anaeromusa acidaminophila]